MREASIADELLFDALPEDTRKAIERLYGGSPKYFAGISRREQEELNEDLKREINLEWVGWLKTQFTSKLSNIYLIRRYVEDFEATIESRIEEFE